LDQECPYSAKSQRARIPGGGSRKLRRRWAASSFPPRCEAPLLLTPRSHLRRGKTALSRGSRDMKKIMDPKGKKPIGHPRKKPKRRTKPSLLEKQGNKKKAGGAIRGNQYWEEGIPVSQAFYPLYTAIFLTYLERAGRGKGGPPQEKPLSHACYPTTLESLRFKDQRRKGDQGKQKEEK